ncbi:anti-sigma factor family protein [Paraglaciecola hydrolytica]|uniref:Anti-sigma factor n=1 Tax=Paraglaciecola hydrolytica TaxID=1799789 RepID=A0A135ZYZ7_9ALTE|nr:hypothetical protein [Paraglaciecola hydrolytica]KXI28203.1 hypothetical protein AX660_17650 [Paraglaciecola hydrolytica]
MNISNEQLSAFLDAELPETEMQAIRERMAQDDELAMRLAELAQVDEWVAEHASQIDQQPVPAAITKLLNVENNVVQLSAWRKVQNQLSQHAALAAGVALCFGLVIGQSSQTESVLPEQQLSASLAEVLNTANSGDAITLTAGVKMTPRLSFVSQNGQYCRQYSVQSQAGQNDSIACHGSTGWQLAASTYSDGLSQSGEYKTASQNVLLDSVIDQLIAGPALNKQQETQAISQAWIVKP